jgi:hypothetical protein
MPSEAENLLFHPRSGFGHYVLIALAPQFLSVKKRSGDASARGFDDVLSYGTGIQRGQLAMPEDDFGAGNVLSAAASRTHISIHHCILHIQFIAPNSWRL